MSKYIFIYLPVKLTDKSLYFKNLENVTVMFHSTKLCLKTHKLS